MAVALTHSMKMMAQIKQIAATTQPPIAAGSRPCTDAPQGDTFSAEALGLSFVTATASRGRQSLIFLKRNGGIVGAPLQQQEQMTRHAAAV